MRIGQLEGDKSIRHDAGSAHNGCAVIYQDPGSASRTGQIFRNSHCAGLGVCAVKCHQSSAHKAGKRKQPIIQSNAATIGIARSASKDSLWEGIRDLARTSQLEAEKLSRDRPKPRLTDTLLIGDRLIRSKPQIGIHMP